MKAHKYWSLGALATMIGTFYTGYKNNDIEKAQSLNSLSFSLVYRSFVHSFSYLLSGYTIVFQTAIIIVDYSWISNGRLSGSWKNVIFFPV